MGSRLIQAGVLCLLLLSVAAAPAHAGAAAPPPDPCAAECPLAGEVTLTATESSSVRVVAPSAATLSLELLPDAENFQGLRFDDGPGFAALVIAPDVAQPLPIRAVRLPQDGDPSRRVVALTPGVCEVCTLAAGAYRLYVITGGEPVTVRLTLSGLGGSTAIRATGPVTGGVHGADIRTEVDVPYTVTGASWYGAGFAPEVESDYGMMFFAQWYRGSDEPFLPVPPLDQPLLQVGQASQCAYPGGPPPVGAFAPGCPGGIPGFFTNSVRALDGFSIVQWASMVGVTSGVHGYGGYGVHTGMFGKGFVGFWLDLAP